MPLLHFVRIFLGLTAFAIGTAGTAAAGEYQISQRGPLLLAQDFDSATQLPEHFREGAGQWVVVNHTLRGQQQEADHHTAFRKIHLDHQDVIYEFDVKIEGDAFTQLLINYDLVHLAKAVIRVDEFSLVKLSEETKRRQMIAQNRHQGLDPLLGDWTEKNTILARAPFSLQPGRWYHVVVEMIGDQLAMQLDGHAIAGRHRGITEKKTNFGFQAGGLSGYVYFDNIKVWQALPPPTP